LRKTPLSRPLIVATAAVFLALAVLFIFIFGDWVRSAVVVPVMYFLWLISNILNSVDQQILWSILLLLALAVLAQGLFSRSRTATSPLEEEGPLRSQGRVMYWLIYVNLILKGVYNRSYFSEELKRLILSVIALRERQLPIDVEKRILSGDMPVPEQVLLIFKNPRRNMAGTPSEKIIQAIKVRVKPNSAENRPGKLDDLQAVITFLEEQMERR
jgi:hypothetical protein